MSPAETVESIAAYLGRFAALRVADIERFVAKGRSRVLEPGDSFCRLGQQTHEVGFIQAGIARYLVTLPDGNEATKDFSFNGSFTLSFGSAAIQRPAQVAIAAVVRTELLVWPYQVTVAITVLAAGAAVAASFLLTPLRPAPALTGPPPASLLAKLKGSPGQTRALSA